MNYKVYVTAAYSHHCEVEVEADNELEAEQKVIEMDYNGELVFEMGERYEELELEVTEQVD